MCISLLQLCGGFWITVWQRKWKKKKSERGFSLGHSEQSLQPPVSLPSDNTVLWDKGSAVPCSGAQLTSDGLERDGQSVKSTRNYTEDTETNVGKETKDVSGNWKERERNRESAKLEPKTRRIKKQEQQVEKKLFKINGAYFITECKQTLRFFVELQPLRQRGEPSLFLSHLFIASQ